MSLRARALDYFVEPASDAPAGERGGAYLAPVAAAPLGRAATRFPFLAAVLGSVSDAIPVGALLANALRSTAGASTAVLAVWAPGVPPPARGGTATLAASRLAARLTARGLAASSRGRLAWLALDDHPLTAAVAVRRVAGAVDVPVVVVLAGPRCEVVESVLAEQDLVVVACSEPDGPLARLAIAGCASATVACTPPSPGPSRWLARSGMAGARGLPAPLRSLVSALAVAPGVVAGSQEDAW